MNHYRARWIFPGDGPPLENATIGIDRGHVIEIGSKNADAVDLGCVAIIPGLINAHTHLEFSSITQPIEPLTEFAAWIQAVIRFRQTTVATLEESIATGIAECLRAGTTAVAEIATTDWRDRPRLKHQERMPTTVMFREYLGLADEAVQTHLADAERFLNSQTHKDFIPGLSPHAPYSLHPELLDGLCKLAVDYEAPLAMHLAESEAELELLKTGGGAIAKMLTAIGVFRPELFSSPQRPLDFLKRLDGGVSTLVVHGNLLDDEEIEFIAERPHFSVVYCPRTHAAMQKSVHPWRKMLEADINVTLGTDSRASNPDLSIWGELCFLKQQHPEFKTSELLKLATQSAARALKLENQGLLREGFAANLCIVPLDELAVKNAEDSLLSGALSPQRVMLNGHWRDAAYSA